MVKRKEPSASSFPSEVHLQPANKDSSTECTGPFVAYFSSGYCPGKDEDVSFEVHRNVDRPREHCLVVQKVSITTPCFTHSDLHCTNVMYSRSASRPVWHLVTRTIIADACFQDRVKFVGSTADPEGPAACRQAWIMSYMLTTLTSTEPPAHHARRPSAWGSL